MKAVLILALCTVFIPFSVLAYSFTIPRAFNACKIVNSDSKHRFAFAMQVDSERSTLFDKLEDDDVDQFKKITSNYLKRKLELYVSTKDDLLKNVLTSILPPVTITELNEEIAAIMKTLKQDSSKDSIIEAVMNNSYWAEAGPLVVQELIYLDSLYSYYHQGTQILNDEDFNDLKDELTWAGSDIASMSSKEALFVTAVTAYRRGDKLLDDIQYNDLKSKLTEAKSWVVAREADHLEKLGLNTFLGYLHRSLS